MKVRRRVKDHGWRKISPRSQRSLDYQAQITGHPGEAFQLNDVDFDGVLEGRETLFEAKGPGYAKLFNLGFGDSVISKLLDQRGRWRLPASKLFGTLLKTGWLRLVPPESESWS